MADENDKTQAKAPEEEAPAAAGPQEQAPKDEAKTDEAPKQAAKEAVEEAPSRSAKPLPEGVQYIWGTGRRKKAVARVRIRPGTGNVLINKRELDEFFHRDQDRQAVMAPVRTVEMVRSWDIWVNVGGGGTTGQAGAIKLGLARALAKAMPELEGSLRGKGLLTRDARMSERKKYGQRGARRRFQFSKR